MTARRYIGFYWTRPVPWAGFTALPRDANDAAKMSMTVRYQRERVWRWVRDERGELIAEEAFIEVAPDRGTKHIVPEVDRLLRICREQEARP